MNWAIAGFIALGVALLLVVAAQFSNSADDCEKKGGTQIIDRYYRTYCVKEIK